MSNTVKMKSEGVCRTLCESKVRGCICRTLCEV